MPTPTDPRDQAHPKRIVFDAQRQIEHSREFTAQADGAVKAGL